jgi:plasmid stabilization system protein ParE
MKSPTPPRLDKHEQAKQDLIEIYAYLSSRDDRAARRFLAETREACLPRPEDRLESFDQNSNERQHPGSVP